MNDILVSISCSTYNHEKYIVDAIEGFLMQKADFKFEILIHDDASTDKTAEIIREYEKKHPDLIKPIYQTESQYSKGIKVSNFNRKRAQGKYIAICEGDDYWIDSLKLQKQVDFMNNHPECSMCFHAAKILNVKNNAYIGLIRPYNKTFVLSNKKLFIGGGGSTPTASILYKKELTNVLPDFYYSSPVGDHALALFLSSNGSIGYIDEVMSVRRLWVPSSWNTLYHNEWSVKNKKIHLVRMIKTLEEFNKYSGARWDSDVAKYILNWKLRILSLQGTTNPLKDDECKKLMKRLTFFTRIKIYFRIFLPNAYNWLRVIKGKIKNKLLNTENEYEVKSRYLKN